MRVIECPDWLTLEIGPVGVVALQISLNLLFLDVLLNLTTVEPRLNEVAGERPNLFIKSRVRYIENLDVTNLRETTKMFVISRS